MERGPAPRMSSFPAASRRSFVVSVPRDIEAVSFSTPLWEPSFYQGLVGPSLHSALRGGITYSWGLRDRPGPEIAWMLSPATVSSRGASLPTADFASENVVNPWTGYGPGAVTSFRGSYLSCDLHIERTIDAICRAIVSFARFGFVPPSSNCW